MKAYPLFLLLILLSCHEDNIKPEPAQVSAAVTATVNGEQWFTDSIYCYHTNCQPGKLSIIIQKYADYSGELVLREEFGFTKIILDSTIIQKMYGSTFNYCYNDTLETSYSTLTDDGDVIGSSYAAEKNANNYLTIDHYDTLTKEISGSFEVNYIKQYGETGPNEIKFTNGKFHTKIMQ